MKKIIYAIFIFLTIVPLMVLCIDVYAENNDVQAEKQIINVGGTSSNQEDEVEVSKIISSGGLENYFDITLKVKTTSSVDEIIDSNNLAVVFVLDRSYTMSSGTRWKSAVNAAVTLSQQLSQLGGVRMAAIGFSGGKFREGGNGGSDVAYDDTKDYRNVFKKDAFTVKELGGEKGWDNDSYYRGGTNIEAGLYRAKQLLDTLPNTVHKKIILLSDGVPTFYYNNQGFTQGTGNSNTQEKMRGVPECRDQAIGQAVINKNSGIDIYTVGYELNNLTYVFKAADGTPLVEYDIAVDTLTRIASSSNQFYQASTSSIQQIFNSILDKIRIYKETVIDANWVANDPMGIHGNVNIIDFIGFYDDNQNLQDSLSVDVEEQSNTATYDNNTNSISWDIKKSVCSTEQVGNKTYYIYTIKYRIRLKNETTNPMFLEDEEYFTNGKTTLKYVIKEGEYISNGKEIEFKIPSVKGYLEDFKFTKVSSQNGRGLLGAKFELVHDSNCLCHQERKHVDDNILKYEAVSTADGTVSFNNIPSGHKYILKELVAPNNFILSSTTKNIEINYGVVSGIPLDYRFVNEVKKGNLEISKLLEGNTNNTDLFDIKLEVWFEGELLTGTYQYLLNDSVTGEINLKNEILRLGNNHKLVIYDLPIESIYRISEITTNGYQVKYQVNSNDIGYGAVAVCNSDNNCKLTEGNNNFVKFINYAEYEMPDTGSSSMLIIVIIGMLLLAIPVIYIGYLIYEGEIRLPRLN